MNKKLLAVLMIPLACSIHAQETAKQPKEAAATVAQSSTVPLSREIILNEVKAMATRVRAGSPNDVARTGSKTDIPLRDIPASVAVVPAAILREQGAYTMNDAMRNVSSIQPHMAGGYGFADQFTSRGLLMSFLRDGIPDGPAQNGYTRTMYDVDRIEVLKGPGSALFGAGNPGGSINMVTLRPQDKFGLSMGTFLGSFGTRNGYLDLTGPMGQRAAGRVIADIEHADGFRGLTRDIMEISPSMTWNIDNNKTLRIDFNHRDIQVKPDNFGILFDARGDLANVSRETRYYTPFNKTNQRIDRIGVTHDWIISDTLSMRTAVAYDHRDLDLIRNLSATVSLANDAVTGRNARRQSDSANYTTFQNELIWKTNTGPVNHTLLGGIEYKNTNIKSNVDIYLFPDIANIRNPVITETSLSGNTNFQLFDRKMTSDTISFYGQDQLAFGERWKLRGGVRHDIINYEDKGFERSVQSLAGVSKYRELVHSKSFTTGSIGGVFQPTPFLAFYAGYSTGAFINLATESKALPAAPETSSQIEVGAKTTLLNDKLDLNVALFDTQRNNYFILLPGSGGLPTQDGRDRSRGVELSFNLNPVSGWNILGNSVWMDPETLSRAVASNANFGIKDQSIHGTRPAGVSNHISSLWQTYQIQTGAARGLTFGFGATHRSDAFADNLNLLKVPAYTVFDAAISYRSSYRLAGWEAALNLRNLTDTNYFINPTFAGALPGNARSIFGSLRFFF